MHLRLTMLRRTAARMESAFTFIEVMGAALLVGVFLSGAFYANSRALDMLRASRETAVASKILQERMEKLRGATWASVTDSATLKEMYATGTSADNGLSTVAETVTVSAWPTATTPIQITRSGTSAATLVCDNPDLVDGSAVLVTTRVTWTTAGPRNRARETCTVIANGGLGR